MIRNLGADSVHLDFDAIDDDQDATFDLAPGTSTRTMPGPVKLRCTSTGTSGTKMQVRVWGSDGLSLDSMPAKASSGN